MAGRIYRRKAPPLVRDLGMIFIGLMKIRISGHWTMNLNLPEKEIGSLTERQGRYRWCPGKVKGYLCEEISVMVSRMGLHWF